MAILSAPDRELVRAQIAKELSAERSDIPVGKTVMLTGIDDIDGALETAEADVLAGIKDAAMKAWLGDADLLRRAMEITLAKRREVL